MRYIICFFALMIGTTGMAQTIETDRPDQTESSGTVSSGRIQLEMGALFYDDGEQEIQGWLAPSVLMRYGVSNTVELRFALQHESHEITYIGGPNSTVSGLSDLQIGLKVKVLDNSERNVRIAFLSHAVLPTAKEDLSADAFGLINKLAVSHDLGEVVGIGYNLGYDYVGEHHYFTNSVALGIGLSNSVGLFLETYGTLGEGGTFESNFDFGFTCLVNSNFQLDLSYGTGLNHEMSFLAAGLSWRSGKK